MRLRLAWGVAVLFVWAFLADARAETAVIIVNRVGQPDEAAMQLIKATAEKALRDKGWTVVEPFSVNITEPKAEVISQCLLKADAPCIQQGVRAATGVTHVMMLSVRATGPVDGSTLYRLVAATSPASGQPVTIADRSCPQCTAQSLATTADDLLDAVMNQRAATGTLEIRSDPSGATVVLDGEPIGITPLTTQVQSGTRVVRFVLEGYTSPPDVSVSVKPGDSVPVSRTLVPKDGTVIDRGSSSPLRTMKWVVGGAGVAFVGAGLVALLVLDDPPKQGGDRSEVRWNVPGYVALAGGGALLAASVVMFVLDRPKTADESNKSVDVSVILTPGLVGVGAMGRF
jgi:PEGA domain